MAAALAAGAELPDGAGEELRAGTYHEQRRARRRRRREEGPRVVSGARRRSHRPVQPRVAVDRLAGEDAAAAYGTPTLAGVIRAVVLPRQAQPHAPRLLALAQGVVALQAYRGN